MGSIPVPYTSLSTHYCSRQKWHPVDLGMGLNDHERSHEHGNNSNLISWLHRTNTQKATAAFFFSLRAVVQGWETQVHVHREQQR